MPGSTRSAWALLALLVACGVHSSAADWQTWGSNSISPGQAYYPSLSIDKLDANRPFIAYSDTNLNTGTGRAVVKRLVNNAWSPLALNASVQTATDLWLASNPKKAGRPWLAFSDGAHDAKLSVVAWTGTKWIYVGCSGAGISTDAVAKVQLAFAPDGTAYVAYQDAAVDGALSVQRYVEYQGWQYVGGGPGVTMGSVDYISLAVGFDGTPYVAFQDFTLKGRVLKLSGNAFAPVGGPFSAQEARHISLAMGPGLVPHVAFTDAANGNRVSVKRFIANQGWKNLGIPGFSGPFSGYNSLAFSQSQVPHVAFQCPTGPGATPKPCVRYYNQTNNVWLLRGSAGFSVGEAGLQDVEPYLILRFAGNTPAVSYSDKGLSGRAIVKRYV